MAREGRQVGFLRFDLVQNWGNGIVWAVSKWKNEIERFLKCKIFIDKKKGLKSNILHIKKEKRKKKKENKVPDNVLLYVTHGKEKKKNHFQIQK